MYKGDMLTNSDINKLKEIFITKEELLQTENSLKSEFISGFDAVMHELKSIREEITVMFYRQSDNTDKIESNSKRITHLEEKLSF